MELQTPSTSNGGTTSVAPDGGAARQPTLFSDDSACSTPYTSAPSSPSRGGRSGFYFSAPTSPMHSTLASSSSGENLKSALSFEFELTGSGEDGSEPTMSSADELFLNGQIRPMTVPNLAEQEDPAGSSLVNGGEDGDRVKRGRNVKVMEKSHRRRTRSMSPFRNATATPFDFEWSYEEDDAENSESTSYDDACEESYETGKTGESVTSSSPSSSSRSKRWIFLKDFLRSKSEGRSSNRHKLWSAIAREKKFLHRNLDNSSDSKEKKNGNGVKEVKKRNKKTSSSPSSSSATAAAHQRHYAAKRAEAEEMRKRTYLPYRQGLLGCLGFTSKGYGAVNGLARALNPVSSGS